jgi:Histidine kinase
MSTNSKLLSGQFEASTSMPRPSARWVYLSTALISAVIAGCMAVFTPSKGTFGELLVISEFIGIAIASLSMLAHRVLAVDKLPSPWGMVLCQTIALPFGYGIGLTLARAVLGQPFQWPFQVNSFVGTGAALVATIVISLAMWSYAQREQSRRAQERTEHLLAQAELRMLRAQLEPHMLFNTLANLRALIEEDPKTSLVMVDQFIAYLRGALAGSRVNERPLSEEFDQIIAYLALMKHRFGAKLTWHTDLPTTLNNALVPSFLLQPLIENAVRHGIEPLSTGGSVALEATISSGMLVLKITNDRGNDLSLNNHVVPGSIENLSGSNYGLAHVRQRLKASYGDSATFVLDHSVGQRTIATLTLPYQQVILQNAQ